MMCREINTISKACYAVGVDCELVERIVFLSFFFSIFGFEIEGGKSSCYFFVTINTCEIMLIYLKNILSTTRIGGF